MKDTEFPCSIDGKKSDDPIAKKLRSLRAEYEYTQLYVAKQLGISQQAYSNYEKGISKMSTDMIVKVCDLYGISSDSLLGITSKKDAAAQPKSAEMSFKKPSDDNEMLLLFKEYLKNRGN